MHVFRVYDESSSGGVPQRDQGILLHDKQLLDVPRLLDIAALYAWSNPELTKELLTKVPSPSSHSLAP